MLTTLMTLLATLSSILRSRAALELENLALRHQIGVLRRTAAKRLKLTSADRLLWICLSRLWRGWRSALTIVKPVIAWHRAGFRLFWTWKVRRGQPGRPIISPEVRALIRKMGRENPSWGAPRIHGELLKLGFNIGESSVSKYMVRSRKPPSQTWRTFLEIHAKQLVSIDFFTVPTTYLGYALRVRGNMGSEAREFLVGVGESAQAKHQFQVGATVSGEALPVADPRLEIVEFYKVSNLKVAVRKVAEETPPPPWRGVAPPLSVYRERGHWRLATRTYEEKCTTCLWGCQMAVEMIIDQWNPSKRRYRTETFCYGPRSCPLYRSGPARKVPGRHGMSYTEEDWVDDEATSRRGSDE